MKRRITAAFAIVLAALAAPAQAHEGAGGNFGVGVGIGSPTALSLEVSPVPWSSFELALGMFALDEDNMYAHLVYKLNVVHLSNGPTVRVPIYLGLGAFVHDHGAADWGARFPLGVNFDFSRVPVQLFAEAAVKV